MSETIEESFQLSPQQEQLWTGEPEGPSGRVQIAITLTGAIDDEAVRRALLSIISRHEILRTTFVRQAGIRVPVQVVHDALEPAWRVFAPSAPTGATNATSAEPLIRHVAATELTAPLNLAEGPVLRAALVRCTDRHTLLLTVSSLCADAPSAAVVAAELAHALGGAGELAPDPLQYADFAAWQGELATSEEPEATAAREFWGGVDAAHEPTLPFSGTPGPHPVASMRRAVALDAATADALGEQASRYGASLEAFVHAAWYVVLARSTGQDTVTALYVPGDRRHADLDGAVGALSRSVPLTLELERGLTFAEVAQALGRARADAAVWQDYAPVEATPGLSVGFVAAGRPAPSGGVSLDSVVDAGRDLSLALTCLTGEGALRLDLDLDPSVTSEDAADRLVRRLARTLAAVASDPGVRIGRIDILDAAEREELLTTFNETAPPSARGTVVERFAVHAGTAPSRPAVIDENGALTYGELDERSTQLAHLLARAGVSPGASVGLCADRSTEMVVGLLGILKAGAAYVPLHQDHPPARLRTQLETAGATAIVTQTALLPHLPEFDGRIVCLDGDRAALDAEPRATPALSARRDGVAYVIYTSGSTGTPKGVAVTHANLDNYARFIIERVGADREKLSFGLVTSIATDLGNTSVFGALCSGGTLVLINPLAAADAGAVAKLFAATPVDVLKITPSHIGALLAGGDPAVLPRRRLVVGGERAPWDLVERVRSVSAVPIINHYGPTEATIGCCTYDVPDGPGEYAPASVPIGAPIAGARCYVLDEDREPVALGVPGQLFIGGRGVARGYVGQPELTTERFLPDPFAGDRGATVYDTGDLARWLPDGTLEFLGRADDQVKIRGYRVELGEIETVLRKHPLVTEAVVVAAPAPGGETRLVAYCQTSGPTDQVELTAHLQAFVPDFMLPSAIVLLDALPQTPSGKIDRQALPDPASVSAPTEEYVAPATPLEETIAAIWSKVLGVERVGTHDDFFALGGHSLLATQIVAQVRSEFAVELPLHSLFIYPTVATLADEIVGLMGDSEGDETAKLMAELEALSDEEAARLLADEAAPPESHT